MTTLAAAVAHPLRTRCLVVMAERTASPAEIARELHHDVSNIGYHVTALAEANLVEEVRTRHVRGAVEHFYRAVALPCLTAEDEEELTIEERRAFAETTVSIYAANAAHAIQTGTLLDRTDHHLTRVSLDVDEDGWEELTAAYMELYERVFEIRALAGQRIEAAKEKQPEGGESRPIRVVSFQSLFEVPPLS